MAFTPYHNIDGSNGVDVELLAPGDNSGGIKSILITNTATAAATVSLFIQNNPTAAAASTFFMLSTLTIPVGASLLLDNSDMLSFNNNLSGYGLYVTVDSSDTLDILIKK